VPGTEPGGEDPLMGKTRKLCSYLRGDSLEEGRWK
jgi:hypothetical protein